MAGIDEVGRGPLAGPVVAAAVVLGSDVPAGLADSKRVSARRRAVLDIAIRARCAWGIGVVEAPAIDRLNIGGATMLAMTLAMEDLERRFACRVERALVDGNLTPEGRAAGWRWPARAIVGGDGTEPAISAASIIAKEFRDALMREAATRHPGYGWERNAGYGTAEHLAALARLGPTPLHRRSFAPVARVCAANRDSGEKGA